MYFITTKRMLEVCFSAHPNIQYRTEKSKQMKLLAFLLFYSSPFLAHYFISMRVLVSASIRLRRASSRSSCSKYSFPYSRLNP